MNGNEALRYIVRTNPNLEHVVYIIGPIGTGIIRLQKAQDFMKCCIGKELVIYHERPSRATNNAIIT